MTNALASMEKISGQMNVGMDEVVSIFVSKYETSLHAKKDALQQKSRDLKAAVESLTKALIAAVDRSIYAFSLPQIGIKGSVDEVTVNWTAKNGAELVVKIEVVDSDNTDRYRQTLNKNIVTKVNSVDADEHKRLVGEQEATTTELAAVLAEIKNIGRKERQVRGVIAERKLEQLGMSDLLNDSGLQQLLLT